MNENRQVVNSEALRPSARARLNETFDKQKSIVATNKRKNALAKQSQNSLNVVSPQGTGAEKGVKRVAKTMEIPSSLDIDNPFSTDTFTTNPRTEMDKRLSAKTVNAVPNNHGQQQYQQHQYQHQHQNASSTTNADDKPPADSPSVADQQEIALLKAKLKKTETELITLKHQLSETKSDLKAAEDRLREKDSLIKEQEERIDELIETRVPQDDMDSIMADNKRLAQELKDNEALLAECQKLLEEYVAADEAS
ncbi:hypothetical protein GGI12_001471 [Dipsacomyces acuminosporus]|nr:hypothetical protein GGI12_001471 [Dipsacomyces acuminosporus]